MSTTILLPVEFVKSGSVLVCHHTLRWVITVIDMEHPPLVLHRYSIQVHIPKMKLSELKFIIEELRQTLFIFYCSALYRNYLAYLFCLFCVVFALYYLPSFDSLSPFSFSFSFFFNPT